MQPSDDCSDHYQSVRLHLPIMVYLTSVVSTALIVPDTRYEIDVVDVLFIFIYLTYYDKDTICQFHNSLVFHILTVPAETRS